MSHLKDLFVWINESEHFKLGVVQKDGNLKSVFQRLMLNVENIWNYFKWVQDEDNLGKVHRQNQWAQRVPTLFRNKLLCQLFGALNGQWFHILKNELKYRRKKKIRVAV